MESAVQQTRPPSAYNLEDHRFLQPRRLLIAASPGAISPAMRSAVEREFPWLALFTVEHLGAALSGEYDGVELILVEARFLDQLRNCWEVFAARFPAPRLALITDTRWHPSTEDIRMFDPTVLRGVISLDVRLDVFLSSLRILLSGGTHFSVPTLQDLKTTAVPAQHPSVADEGQSRRCLNRLTARELEVITYLASGSQNKVIAAELGLSENTVKIHIHNVISKLGVHNRTEAAMLFMREMTASPTPRLPL